MFNSLVYYFFQLEKKKERKAITIFCATKININ